MKVQNSGFTLIELLVAISILGVIMVSVFTIFFVSSDLNNKTDVSRSLQENVKHITETIAETVRTKQINGLSSSVGSCSQGATNQNMITGNKICFSDSQDDIYVAELQGAHYIRVDDVTKCSEKTNACILVKSGEPISNSWVEVENLEFTLFAGNPQKVQVNFTLRPSSKKGVKPELIEKNTIHIQTTFSKRNFQEIY